MDFTVGHRADYLSQMNEGSRNSTRTMLRQYKGAFTIGLAALCAAVAVAVLVYDAYTIWSWLPFVFSSEDY